MSTPQTGDNPRRYPVPYGFKVEVSFPIEGDSTHVDVHAPLYMRKYWRMLHCYSTEHFTPAKILRDHSFVTAMLEHYHAP